MDERLLSTDQIKQNKLTATFISDNSYLVAVADVSPNDLLSAVNCIEGSDLRRFVFAINRLY